MDLLKREKLRALVDTRERACVSIYLPTHRYGRESEGDPIRLKNLVNQAEQRLVGMGWRTPDAQALLKPARDLIPAVDFWLYQSDGLALFIAEDAFHTFRLPAPFEELLVVSDRFYIKPLFSLLSGDGQFYILALSQKQVRLLQATRDQVDEVALDELPQSLQEALWFDDPERQLQFRTSTQSPGGRGARPAIFHGHGVGINDAKNNILRYFNIVDDGLQKLLEGRWPMVLASVDYLIPIYHQASSYPHLVDDGVHGNPDEKSPEELHRQAWALVQPLFRKEQTDARARFLELTGQGSQLVSSDLREVVKAAYHGRVEVLFVPLGVQRWGSYDVDAHQVRIHDNHEAGDQDLLDFAAAHTFIQGGKVYALDKSEVPGGSDLAALFRYEW